MSTNPLAMTPAGAASAYGKVQGGSTTGVDDPDDPVSGSDGSGFGSTLQRALDNVVQTGNEADVQTAHGIAGDGNITDVVMAVSRAQLALQSTVAIRDKVVQAYQNVMQMSI